MLYRSVSLVIPGMNSSMIIVLGEMLINRFPLTVINENFFESLVYQD